MEWTGGGWDIVVGCNCFKFKTQDEDSPPLILVVEVLTEEEGS
jgi:hypothetical protein